MIILLSALCGMHMTWCLQQEIELMPFKKRSLFSQATEKEKKIQHAVQCDVAATRDLVVAIHTDDVPQAAKALLHDADPNMLFKHGFITVINCNNFHCNNYHAIEGPLLHYAVLRKLVAMVQLLAHTPGIDLNACPKDYEGEISAVGGRYNSFDYHYASTPLYIAVSEGQLALINILLDAGADIEAGDGVITPLCRACYQGSTEVAKLLIRRGAQVNVHKSTYMTNSMVKETPLYATIHFGNPFIVKMLCAAGANVNIYWGRSLLDYALENHPNRDIIATLLRYGAQLFYESDVYQWVNHYEHMRATKKAGPLPANIWLYKIIQQVHAKQARKLSKRILAEHHVLPQELADIIGQYVYTYPTEALQELHMTKRNRIINCDQHDSLLHYNNR